MSGQDTRRTSTFEDSNLGGPASTQLTGIAEEVVQQVLEKRMKWVSPTGLKSFLPKAMDTVITTFPKAGTTLLQQMAYQVVVASGGAPAHDPNGTNYTDINEVVPWMDYIPEFEQGPCESRPRLFKSHSKRRKFLEADLSNLQHIVVVRDPESYPSSWLEFLFDDLCDEVVTDDALQEAVFHEYVKRCLFGLDKGVALEGSDADQLGPWFEHTLSWLPPDPKTLVLFYEDVTSDLAGAVRKVAEFLKCDLPDRSVHTVVALCDKKKMASDTRFTCGAEARAFGFGTVWKVKAPSTKGYRRFSLNEQELAVMRDMMQRSFAVKSYDELRAKYPNVTYAGRYHPRANMR